MSEAKQLFYFGNSLEQYFQIKEILHRKKKVGKFTLVMQLTKRVSLFSYFAFSNFFLLSRYKVVKGDLKSLRDGAFSFITLYQIVAMVHCFQKLNKINKQMQ
jgi:hypothetical protein